MTIMLMGGLLIQSIFTAFKIQNADHVVLNSNHAFLDLTKVGPIDYMDTKMKIVHVIRRGTDYDLSQEELKKYLEIEFV